MMIEKDYKYVSPSRKGWAGFSKETLMGFTNIETDNGFIKPWTMLNQGGFGG